MLNISYKNNQIFCKCTNRCCSQINTKHISKVCADRRVVESSTCVTYSDHWAVKVKISLIKPVS